MNRRLFLKTSVAAVVPSVPVAAAGYGLFEASWVRIDRRTVPLPRLPRPFDGLTVAFLTDIHHGPYTPIEYVQAVVRTTLTLQPDLIVLGGDYSHRGGQYIAPCFEALAGLQAPLGVYGVFGNHDYWNGADETRQAMGSAGVRELTNDGVWLSRGGERFRLAGVDDLWAGRPDLDAAVGDARPDDSCLLVSHNPDLAETLRDRRVGLMLSGHTHGGQVVFPSGGAPYTSSRYGQKYLYGLVQAPVTRVFVSRGLGTTHLPVRVGSRPEINLLTLASAAG
jgi:predicted MPP superfamily phosphohydrolase